MAGENLYLLGATIATGFERTALEECKEKLGGEINAHSGRGRVFFHVGKTLLKKALELRTIDHLFVVVRRLEGLNLYQEKDESITELCRHLTHADWVQALDAWTHFRGVEYVPTLLDSCRHQHPVPKEDTVDPEEIPADPPKPPSEDVVRPETSPVDLVNHHADATQSPPYLPTFRVTGHRVGTRHNFSSQDAAGKLGEYLIRHYGLPVSLKNFEMEVLVNVNEDSATIGINLTQESMHKRNIVHFGPTTLRSTLAHCMLRLGEPQPGDVICDPMCGGGSIPLEASQNWPCFVLGGDNHDIACLHAGGNVSAMNEKRQSKGRCSMSVDVLQWDVTNLPLRSDSIDIMVSDMPFGKRIGSRLNNWELYRLSLFEMGRVCRRGSGKAVLLTQDRKCMGKILMKVMSVWKKQLQLTINIGGLQACVYVLKRRGRPTKVTTEQGNDGGQLEQAEDQL